MSNSRDQMVLNKAMDYPVIRQLLTYRPTSNKTLGTVMIALFPLGLPLWLVGLRHQKNLKRDLSQTIKTCDPWRLSLTVNTAARWNIARQ